MKRELEYYLRRSADELKNLDLKREILYNDEHYMFVWFCQQASQEQLMALLDEEGINLFAGVERLRDKIEGLLTCGKETYCFENETFCEMVIENGGIDSVWCLKPKDALDFAKYVSEHKQEKMLDVYRGYDSKNQINVLKERLLKDEDKTIALRVSKKEAAEILLDMYSIDINDLRLAEIENLAEKKVVIPKQRYTDEFIDRIAQIGDVNRYRVLMNKMEEYSDTSRIENRRKAMCEKELESINEDGLLPKFQELKDKIKNKTIRFNDKGGFENVDGFEGAEEMLHRVMFSQNIDDDIKKLNDYCVSNMIIDYFFEDIPTNVLKNINSMLAYNSESAFLSEDDKKTYEMFQNIDTFDVEHKYRLFKLIKEQGINMTEKFYDDFNMAKEKMVEQINDEILSKDNIDELYNDNLSQRAGVPVYHLVGQPFKTLIRNIGVHKSGILEKRNLDFMTDGSSFSIDGSELLQVFGDNKSYYTLAYSKVPPRQLVHAFPTDSFSKYTRTYENDISENRDSTERIFGLYTPEQLTNMGKGCNEILISVPNRRKTNELEEQLEKPEAFAIYCYDTIYDTDIESAKKMGLGIILVDTRCYNIDRSNRVSELDTIGQDRAKHSYLKSYNSDERNGR